MIYERIKQRLDKLDMSARRACEMAGLGESFIRDLKRAKAMSPRVEGIEKLAPVLQTTVDWLLSGEGSPDAVPDRSTATVSRLMPRLSAMDREKVAEYARLLAEQRKSKD